jgi:hypothetical protein
MKNEIPVVQKETEIDNSSFEDETKTRVLEMSLIGFVKNSNNKGLINSKIQAPFSTILKDKDILEDEDLYY